MATVDLSLIQNYLPVLAFLLVFTVVFAVLAKTKILGESKFVNLLVSFIVATMFVSVTNAREYILNVTPWFAVFLVSMTFILLVMGFSDKVPDGLKTGLGVVFVIGILVLFLISAFFSFSSDSFAVQIKNWIATPRIYGAVVLIVVAALASWIITRK